MKLLKQIIAMLLALVMVSSMIPANVFAAEQQVSSAPDPSGAAIRGTNGFGDLLSKAVTEKQQSTAEAAAEIKAGCTVTDLKVEGNSATVTYDSQEKAILIAAVYTEDGMQMITSGKTIVTPDATQASVTFEGTMPEYFLASAYLVDIYDHSPLCAAYDTPMYTKEMQMLQASTVRDYDEERVLNLDGSEGTNFAVYAQTTRIMEYVDGFNIVADIGEETGTYVIQNADEQFKSLREGDVFAYRYDENAILILKVGSISVAGTTVTITEDSSLEMGEVFSHMKIEGSADQNGITVKDLDPNDGITSGGSRSGTVSSQSVQTDDISAEFSHHFGIDETFTGMDGHTEVKVQGGLVLTIDAKLDCYISDTREYLRFEVTTDLGIDFHVDGALDTALPPFAEISIPLCAGVYAVLNPTFQVRFSGELVLDTTIETVLGVEYDNRKGFVNLCTTPKLKGLETEMEVNWYIGVNLYPSVNILDRYLLSAELEAPIGILLEAQSNDGGPEDILIGTDNVGPVRHGCEECIDIQASLTMGLKVNLKFLGHKFWDKSDEITIPLVKLPFYLSVTHSEFGYGSCPWKEYRVNVEVQLQDGSPVPYAVVNIGGASAVTGKRGVAILYAAPGSYLAEALCSGLKGTRRVDVEDACKAVVILGVEEEPGFIPGELEEGEIVVPGEGIASGRCGEHANWVVHDNGHMVIWGTGEIDCNFIREFIAAGVIIDIPITYVTIYSGITRIGNDTFLNFRDLKGVSIPHTVTSIGKYAFQSCTSLEYVEIPGAVTDIDSGAFGWCENLLQVRVGGGAETKVEKGAFSNCPNLRSISFGDGGTVFAENVFLNCTALETATIGGHGSSFIGYDSFAGCTGIKSLEFGDESITTICLSAFKEKTSLTRLAFGNGSTTTIEESAFAYCSGLREIDFGIGGTASIGASAFRSCSGLTRLSFPRDVTIDGRAFSDCDGVTEIAFGRGTVRIGPEAFSSCDQLTGLSWGPGAAVMIDTYAFFGCSSLTRLVIDHGGTTQIGDNAFSRCSSLTEAVFGNAGKTVIGLDALGEDLVSITLGSSVVSIKSQCYGFYDIQNVYTPSMEVWCAISFEDALANPLRYADAFYVNGELITDLVIPEGIGAIQDHAFAGFKKLKSVMLPKGLASVGKEAFLCCEMLESLTIHTDGLVIGDRAFAMADGGAVYTDLVKIEFTGDAPVCGTNVFQGVQTAAFYPEHNRTWTSAKMQDYGGALTWLPGDALAASGMSRVNGYWMLTAGGVLIRVPDFWEMPEYTEFDAWEADIQELVLCDGVGGIYKGNFENLTNLRTVTVADTVTCVSGPAFSGCSSLSEIVFRGDAPSFEANSFEGLIATVYYPYDNGTWTEAVMQDYGGDITWAAAADSGACGTELRWILTPGNALVIMGAGAVPGGDHEGRTWTDYAATVERIVINDGVSRIGTCAFADFDALKEITLRGAPPVFAENAFSGKSLTVLYPESRKAQYARVMKDYGGTVHWTAYPDVLTVDSGTFGDGLAWALRSDDTLVISGTGEMPYIGRYSIPWAEHQWRIKYVVIEEGITTVGEDAFYNFTNIRSVVIPSSVTAIGSNAFYGCTGLQELSLPEGLKTIGEWAFWDCRQLTELVLPHSLTKLEREAFGSCDSLKRVQIGDGLTAIGVASFSSCENLTEVVFGKNVHTIGSFAFEYCHRLVELELPEQITAIYNSAFASCHGLVRISIHAGITELDGTAFSECTNLREIRVDKDNPCYANDEAGVLFSKDMSILLTAPGAISGAYVIPDGVVQVGEKAFQMCTGLQEIWIPDSVTKIGEYAFAECTGLTELTIPDSVELIDWYAFFRCENVISVTLGTGVSQIGGSAFYCCYGLNEVRFTGHAPEMSNYAFENVTATVYYPASDPTWTADVLQNYGGTLTWVPDHRTENGERIRREAGAGVKVPARLSGDKGGVLAPEAVFGGEYGTENDVRTAAFTGLVPGQQYVLLVFRSIDAEDRLAADNLLFIDQAEALEDGTLVFQYIQRTACDISYVVACGASGKDLSDAVITFPEMTADGEVQVVDPVVVYDGVTLTEGRDYVITGMVAFTEVGAYTCLIRGIRNYTGLVVCSYQVNKAEVENPFGDVAPGSFFYEPVLWAVENGITNGTSADTFGPDDQCMRAHVVTFLWRAAGCPEPTLTDNPFVDVKPGDFYYKSVLWAVENGITAGLDAAHFGPAAYCNRAQVVTFLYRMMGRPAVESTGNPFADVPEGQWFTGPVLWAVENGITNGLSTAVFGPGTVCNRAQIVTFLYRAFVTE